MVRKNVGPKKKTKMVEKIVGLTIFFFEENLFGQKIFQTILVGNILGRKIFGPKKILVQKIFG